MKSVKASGVKSKRLKRIGFFSSEIVGIQYYENSVNAGDIIHFDRNPHNEFDENAIEARNTKGIIGHFKREQSAWLFSLLDRGEIFLKGVAEEEGDGWQIPVNVEVFITKKGGHILKPRIVEFPAQIIHDHILKTFKNADTYVPSTLLEVRNYYRGMMHQDGILPETRLLFKLLKNKAERECVRPLGDVLEDVMTYFSKIKYDKPILTDGLTVVPLLFDEATDCGYVTGKKALEDKTLVIQEIGEGAQVSRLRATNRGSKPVMLISGEGLKGAKQDRIVNVTVIINVNETVDVPVSCVERGRWSYDDAAAEFTSANFATNEIRDAVRTNVNRKINEGVESFDSDQGVVWDKVSKVSENYCVASETENLNEVFKSRESEIDEIVNKIKYVKNAVGIALFLNGEKLSVDLFQHPDLMKENWNDLIRSAVMDLEAQPKKAPKKKRKKADLGLEIDTFLEEIIAEASDLKENPGTGQYMVSRNAKLEAGTLIDGRSVAHLSGFAL